MSSPSRQHEKEKHRRSDHGLRRDSRGEVQPIDKDRAQQTSQGDERNEGAQPPSRPPGPGQPAGGE